MTNITIRTNGSVIHVHHCGAVVREAIACSIGFATGNFLYQVLTREDWSAACHWSFLQIVAIAWLAWRLSR